MPQPAVMLHARRYASISWIMVCICASLRYSIISLCEKILTIAPFTAQLSREMPSFAASRMHRCCNCWASLRVQSVGMSRRSTGGKACRFWGWSKRCESGVRFMSARLGLKFSLNFRALLSFILTSLNCCSYQLTKQKKRFHF